MLDTLLQMDGWWHGCVFAFIVMLPGLARYHKELQEDET